MKSVVDFIEQNGFIDVVPHKDKQSGAYMSYLRGARLPFVYNNYTDPSVIFHEFGHALGAFMSPDSELPLFDDAGIDIKEFEAMGMEVLATLHYDMLYGDTADHARTAFVYRHFHQLIVATLICEFEILLYEKPRLTKGQRENEFYRMCDQYQIGGYLLWSQISHYFDAPAYYKSYVLNFLPTMELYRVAQSDPALAQKMYMDFLRDTDEHDYIARLNKVGLSNPLDEDALEEIALYLRRFFRSDRYWNP
jgi:oligoendopeptidase F